MAASKKKIVNLPAKRTEPETEHQFIERLARDPQFDPAKLKAIMEVRATERAVFREEQFNNAMRDAQSRMERIAADSNNPQTHSKYASFAALDRVLRPIYTGAGLSVSYNTADSPLDNHVRVVAMVSSGPHTRTYHYDCPIVTTGIKGVEMMTLTHARASAVTYGKRYLLAMIFGIAVDKDDDGNAAGTETITDDQIKTLRDLVQEIGGDKHKALLKGWLSYQKIASIADLPASKFADGVAALEAKRGTL